MHRILFTPRVALLAVLLLCSQALQAQELNLFTQLQYAGRAIWVTVAMSVYMVAVIVDRLRHVRRSAIAPAGLADQVLPLWQAGRFDEIDAIVREHPSTLGRMIGHLVQHRQADFSYLSTSIGDLASLDLRDQLRKAYPLAVIATVAPIVGLLGTVIGMIESFHVIAFSGSMGDPTLLAGGISKALVNTAAGLMVALPALAMHHFFKQRITGFGLELEREAARLTSQCMAGRNPAEKGGLMAVHYAH